MNEIIDILKERLNKNNMINYKIINDDIENFVNNKSINLIDKNIILEIINNFNLENYGKLKS
jgi:dihydroneopterin aldolase